jgi:hypothetical protein
MSKIPKARGQASPITGPTSIFGREAELRALRGRLAARQSFLLHGPSGVGKTLLLSRILPDIAGALYSSDNPTAQVLYRNLAGCLFLARDRHLREACPTLDSIHKKSAIGLKGIVRDALRDSQYLIVLDHVTQSSQSLAAAVRELRISCSVPVVTVSRSDHMEDAGFVLRLYSDRKERCALRNFDPETASQFASWRMDQDGLAATNLSDFNEKLVEYSEGNPGAMLQMIRMARETRYCHDRQIKITPLYIDYKIATVNR